MCHESGIDELKAKKLCHRCIGDTYLSEVVDREGFLGTCSYCGRDASACTIEEIAERVEVAFQQHYRRTADQPTGYQSAMLADSEFDYDWEREGEETVWAIANAADISENVARDIQAVLSDQYFDFDAAAMGDETEFETDAHYAEVDPSDQRWREKWRRFESSLTKESRFFNKEASEFLGAVFSEIETIETSSGRPLVVAAGPGTEYSTLVRARVFQREEKLKQAMCYPDRELGPPPMGSATAGRMNARGVSVFYGATDSSLAIAEVRPPVGSWVAVARFEIVRALRLLDLAAFSDVSEYGSVFDAGFRRRLERIAFLRTIAERIARPVMPDDEYLSYIPTQAVSEFLASEGGPGYDGVLYPSVQFPGGGLNVVLFQRAASVETRLLPSGVTIEAHTGSMCEEGWVDDYWVSEEVLANSSLEHENGESSGTTPHAAETQENSEDPREVSLRLVCDSVTVHVVNRVCYDSSEWSVRRHQWESGVSHF